MTSWKRLGPALLFLAVVAGHDRTAARAARPAPVIAIVNATIIPMDGERTLPAHTVLVEGDRIVAVSPNGSLQIPGDAVRVDASGRFLLPGLIDMHVHIREPELSAYVAQGITSVRNMWGYRALPGIMARIESGEIVGPTIYSASPGFDANPPAWPETQIIEDAARADELVGTQIRAGWRFIKVYQSLKPSVYDAILDSSKMRGIRVIGHVPTQVSVEHALAAGQASIEHLRGYDLALTRSSIRPADLVTWVDIDRDRLPGLVARTVEAGAWNCPTQSIWEVFTRGMAPSDRARVLDNRAATVRALYDGGARLLAGTDSGIDQTMPGISLHDELDDLVTAGLSPYDALRAATSAAAEFLEQQSEVGSIAVGRRADLILVERNPLEDVRALRSLAGILLRGVWIVDPKSPARTLQPPARTPRPPRVIVR